MWWGAVMCGIKDTGLARLMRVHAGWGLVMMENAILTATGKEIAADSITTTAGIANGTAIGVKIIRIAITSASTIVTSLLLIGLLATQAPAQLGGGAASLAELELLKVLELKGAIYHVQGVDLDSRRVWVTSVDAPNRKGYLHEFSLATGALLRVREIQDGDRFHAGGIATDAKSIWIPVAEYRRNSSAVIQQRSKRTFDLEFQFDVPDHIGCIAVTPEFLIGGNWDSREFYIWSHRGKLIRKAPSTTGNAYQDMKFQAGQLVASGVLADGSGAVDWLDLRSLRLLRRLSAGVTDRGVLFTREGMALSDNRLLLLPEDGPSRLFIFKLNGIQQRSPDD
jgi:hypothetical protein